MDKNHVRSGESIKQTTWRRSLRATAAWFLFGALAYFTWTSLPYLVPDGWLRPAAIALLGALGALQALACERGLVSLGRTWRYRLSFLAPLGVYLVLSTAQGTSRALAGAPVIPVWPLFLSLGAVFLGALAGGLAATGFNEGWWENNSPPAENIQAEVYQLHRQVIGVPRRPPWTKRAFDLLLAGCGLLLSLPIWALSVLLVWFESPGPVLFVKNSVGLGGRNFRQFKLRTMVCGAEENTGPVLSQADDHRVLAYGRLLRKTALDELPQLINILRGEMSFVGPRPQRTVLVHGYLQTMPEYAQRHRVLPGLAGLAQVAGDYYLTPRQKLRYDRLYIRYAGLGFDLKLIALAFLLTFWLRWRKDWNGRLPRNLLRSGSKNT